MCELPVVGGPPVRKELLPYGRQSIDDADIDAVVAVLRSDWLTTGPAVERFEREFAEVAGVSHAVAVSSGTAALHAAMFALGIGPGDEVVVPAMTFAATANAVLFQGGTPVFVDVDPDTLLIDPAAVERAITRNTRAVLAVDFAGQPCDYDVLARIARDRGVALVADAAHSLGAAYAGRPAGSLADMTTFSLHPVKQITTGEGGVVTTADSNLAHKIRIFRNHGITTDHRERTDRGEFRYEMVELGYNYRLTDIQCALGSSQLRRLPVFVARRREIARGYNEAFQGEAGILPLRVLPGRDHAYHLYVIRMDRPHLRTDRGEVFRALRSEGVGVNVHYMPVHLHPYYRERLGTAPGLCPVAEAAYEEVLSLPIFPGMTDADLSDVVAAMRKVLAAHAR